eukprot:6170467-Ditylum_brightwellii.AAC.1
MDKLKRYNHAAWELAKSCCKANAKKLWELYACTLCMEDNTLSLKDCMKVCNGGHSANAVSHFAKVYKLDSDGNPLLGKSTSIRLKVGTAATASTTIPGSTTTSMPQLPSKLKAADLSTNSSRNSQQNTLQGTTLFYSDLQEPPTIL